LIYLDYELTISKVRELKALAERLENLKRNFESLMSDTQLHWHGQAANAYLMQCGELRSAMARTRQEMDYIAATIQMVAVTIKAADDRLAQLATETTSTGL
jgi:WXG100 family type VII secretion target